MKYKISDEERSFLKNFKNLSIPDIFKDEYFDYMLFVEEVDFYVCEMLLNEKEITAEDYEWIVSNSSNGYCPCFNDFVKFVDTVRLDKQSQKYYDSIFQVMEIFKKFYLKGNKT